MLKKLLLLLGFMLVLSIPVYADTVISNCTNFTVAGETYLLDTDIFNHTGTCFWLQAQNVTLDCQGHIVDGRNILASPTDNAIYENTGASLGSLTVRNCNISDMRGAGIEVNGMTNVTVTNCNFDNTHIAVTVEDFDYAYFANNSFYFTNLISAPTSFYIQQPFIEAIMEDNYVDYGGAVGINYTSTFTEGACDYLGESLIIRNNNVQRASSFLWFEAGCNIQVYGNIINNTITWVLEGTDLNVTFYNNYVLNYSGEIAYEFYENLTANTTLQTGTRVYEDGLLIGGNYWTNSTGNGFSDTCTDADTDGICDTSYGIVIQEGGLTVYDYLPLSDEYVAPPEEPIFDPLTASIIGAVSLIVGVGLVLIVIRSLIFDGLSIENMMKILIAVALGMVSIILIAGLL